MKYNRFESFKILAYSDKLRIIVEGWIPFPIQLVVYPSNICNYNCGHCIMKEERKNGCVLSETIMNKIVDDCVDFRIDNVIFSGGGEPLTNPFTLPTIKKLHEKGIKTGLNTNGSLLPDASDVDYLRISVDAATKETYKRVHGVDKFDHITNRLQHLNHNELGLAFLITKDNWHEIYQFCEWAQQFNYTFIHIRPAFLKNDNSLRQIVSSLDAVRDAVMKDFREVYFTIDKFEGYWTPRLYDSCRATPLKAVLCADGKFAVCQDNFIKFGDYNSQPFISCWLSEDHKNAIKSIKVDECPRCVETTYNEIIQNCFIEDKMRMSLI